jgi:hypothetical protein
MSPRSPKTTFLPPDAAKSSIWTSIFRPDIQNEGQGEHFSDFSSGHAIFISKLGVVEFCHDQHWYAHLEECFFCSLSLFAPKVNHEELAEGNQLFIEDPVDANSVSLEDHKLPPHLHHHNRVHVQAFHLPVHLQHRA